MGGAFLKAVAKGSDQSAAQNIGGEALQWWRRADLGEWRANNPPEGGYRGAIPTLCNECATHNRAHACGSSPAQSAKPILTDCQRRVVALWVHVNLNPVH